jgi:hypothetical protein
MATEDFAHADTAGVRLVGDRLDPAPAEVTRAAAATVTSGAVDCGRPLAGCQAFIAAVASVSEQIAGFAATVEAGVRTYAAIADGSATEYETRDGTGAALISGTVAGF